MTRTAICHTLSALAALALVSAFAAGPVPAQSDTSHKQEMEYLKQEKWGVSQEQKTPNGLATRRPQQTPTTHYEFRWWQNYGN
jgi:hypothetical protein